MSLIDEALKQTTDTKACVIRAGATEDAAKMFKELFPDARKAIIVEDPRTRQVAGARVEELLVAAGVECDRHVLCPGGEWFHAEYKWIDEVREVIRASGGVPVAVGSGTINDIVKRSSEEAGVRYMVVGTAASMDGYTSYGAAITKDGMKQTLACKAPLGCIVDSKVAAEAPKEMVASGYADLIAKIPAGADWILADAIGSELIHPAAWKFVQGPLRESLSNPAGAASGDIAETEKLCAGLVMSAFAMQVMGSSRPASGTEHQVSHYWDMEDLCHPLLQRSPRVARLQGGHRHAHLHEDDRVPAPAGPREPRRGRDRREVVARLRHRGGHVPEGVREPSRAHPARDDGVPEEVPHARRAAHGAHARA